MMIQIKGYNVIGEIFQDYHFILYRGVRESDNRQILIEAYKPNLNRASFSIFKEDLLKINTIDAEGIGRIYRVEDYGDGIAVISDDFNGAPLCDWRKSKSQIDIDDFLKIAIAIIKSIDGLHRAGRIHGAINSNNILISHQLLEVRLINLVRIVDISNISPFIYDGKFLNALKYVSPEQTGRIKQSIEYSTDFYSLGMVFYELLCGETPFSSSDPLEIIQSHMAETPPPIHKKNSHIPEMLSEIIAKLIQKDSENRYRTAQGLLNDLSRCNEEYRKSGRITAFTPGLEDYSKHISIPSIIVGRDDEIKQLLDEHAISSSGFFRSVLISGLPGIGKTRLIRELELPIITARSYFTSGKFDQYNKNIPYNTLIPAFRNLIQKFLTEDTDRISYWGNTISGALKINAGLITELVPELELIIGPQPDVDSLPPVEARNRFNSVMEKFISCLAGPDHPLTIFIDDLQWCDAATYEVIENIFANVEDHPYLFLIGAYRHNEVDEAHPLSHLLQKVKKNYEMENLILELRIHGLEHQQINEMVAYILKSSSARAEILSEIIGKTSEGNPLYINEMLSWLSDEGLLYLKEDGSWKWDEEKISLSKIPDTIVKLFAERIQKMPEESKKLLQRASCLGASFSAENMRMITGMELENLYRELAPAFEQRILIKGGDTISFFHDRVQEAVYSTFNQEERKTIHNQIAESMISELPDNPGLASMKSLCDIANHLNRGRDYTDRASLYRDARFNLHAGIKAVASLALELANHYFSIAFDILPENCWDEDYGLTYSIYKNLAINQGTQGQQAKAETLFAEILKRIKTKKEKYDIYVERALIFSSMGYHKEAIEYGNLALAIYDRQIPDDDDYIQKQTQCLIDEIKNMSHDSEHRMDEEYLLSLLRCYNILIADYYLMGNSHYTFYIGLLCCKMAGNIQSDSIGKLMSYPLAVCAIIFRTNGDHQIADKIERRALELCFQYPNTFGSVKGLTCMVWLNLHWTKSIEEIQIHARKGYESAANCGDVFYACGSYVAYIWAACFSGKDFGLISREIQSYRSYCERYNVINFADMFTGIEEAFIAPLTNTDVQGDMEKYLNKWLDDIDYSLLGNYYIFTALSRYLKDEQEGCKNALDHGKQYLGSLVSTIPNKIWHIVTVLNGIERYSSLPEEKQETSMLREINEKIELLEDWNQYGVILRPYLAFIYAQKSRISGNFSETRRFFLDAADSARKYGYILLEGHIHECLGKFLSERQNHMARFHINEAAILYNNCHAGAMTALIHNRYPQYFAGKNIESAQVSPPAKTLDTAYLLKSYSAISQELDLNRLLDAIIKSIMERVGAQSAYILTVSGENDPLVRAKGIMDKKIQVIINNESIFESSGIPKSIIRYVQRTRENLILENAMDEGPFHTDNEVRGLKLRSVLCQPIIKRQKLVGIIYLQNSLIKSVFTTEKVELVRLLSAQAGISLENAVMFEEMKRTEAELTKYRNHLEELVEERTADLHALNKEMEAFSYSVSHDLRAPLRHIDGFIRLLEKKIGSDLDEKSRHYIETIVDSSGKMGQLIDDLLSFSRISRVEIRKKTIDLNNIIDEIIEETRTELKDRKINWEIEKLPDIEGDRGLMKVVMANLISNAVKFTNQKDKAKISVGSIRGEKDETVIFIRDNGAGFDMKYSDKLFGVFQRLHGEDEFEGTGIGLATVQRIINRHGGKIWAESEKNKGAVFYFSL